MYTRANPPERKPINRRIVLPFKDIDPFTFVPKGGFLEDIQNYSLGYETTNAFAFWTGVHYLSTMFKRDLWMPWGTEKHFANFYLILLAHPALVRKSTTIRIITPIYDTALDLISNGALAWRKKQELTVSSTATANGMFKLLAEVANKENGEFDNADGERMILRSDANLILRVSEFTTLVSKAQFNANLIDKITDFYDCKDYDSSTTVAHGHIDLKNVFCTMIGATTPTSFQTSMTQEAYGGGFMSRCIVVKEETGYREYPLPVIYEDVPDKLDMAYRLAYVAEKAVGEYTLEGSAYDRYAHWYIDFKKELHLEDPDEILHQDNRRDVNILKLALVLAAQEYNWGRTIAVRHVNAAIEIIDYTLGRASKDVMRASLNPENFMSQKLLGIIEKKGVVGITKSELLRNHRRLFNSDQLSKLLENLWESDDIEIFELGGRGEPVTQFTGRRERYRFKKNIKGLKVIY